MGGAGSFFVAAAFCVAAFTFVRVYRKYPTATDSYASIAAAIVCFLLTLGFGASSWNSWSQPAGSRIETHLTALERLLERLPDSKAQDAMLERLEGASRGSAVPSAQNGVEKLLADRLPDPAAQERMLKRIEAALRLASTNPPPIPAGTSILGFPAPRGTEYLLVALALLLIRLGLEKTLPERRKSLLSIMDGATIMSLVVAIFAWLFPVSPGPERLLPSLLMERVEVTVPFDSASSFDPGEKMKQSVCDTRRELREGKYTSVLVVGRHDRRELQLQTTRSRGSNLGLAQERAESVASMLQKTPCSADAPPALAILTLPAGPRNNDVSQLTVSEREKRLSEDRQTEIYAFRLSAAP